MKKIFYKVIILTLFILVADNLYGQTIFNKSGVKGTPIVCYGNQEVHRVFIPPPKCFDPANKGQGGANFEVEYIDFSDTAKQAFQYAVDIWSTLIKSPVTIRIEANWKNLGTGVLGSCSPSVFYYGGYVSAPISDEYYAVALAEKIFGNEINDTSGADLVANFSSGANWYYGTDGNCPGNKYDLVTVVLHEIAHGLGFIGTMRTIGDSLGTWGFDGLTITFDHWIENYSGERMMDTSIFENPSVALLDEFTSDNLYYNSLISVLNNAGIRPKLYAPSTFNDGSSIYHLDDDTYPPGSGNSLMTHSVSFAEATHNPGPIVMGMFADWGWIHTRFDHEPLKDVEDIAQQPFTVITKILSDTTFNEDTTFVYYSLDNFVTYDSVKLMPTANPDEFSADIPVPAIDTTVHYYLSTYDYFDRHYTYPPYVPDGYFSFYVGPDTIKPVINHVPVEYILVTNDSLKLLATVTDNIGIDSVYIEYYINETGQEPVTMQYDTLNKYSGYLVFPEGTLQMCDSILYRIVAVDISQNANVAYNPDEGYHKIIVDEIRDVQDTYRNDFDTASNDFLFTGFSITSPLGFSDTALHTFHPYESPDQNNETIEYTAQLKIPIHLEDAEAYMSFDEIVLVEPGEYGTSYGDEEFWDYVVIEGSKDNGNNWLAIEPGYDCRRESIWLTKYNSSMQDNNSTADGTPDLYQNHLIDLLQDDDFSGGDTILIRFRLFSDPWAHGWGWAIDNLKIQGDILNPVITHVPVEYTLVSIDSLKFLATVTDNIGIDSVYIEYYLNETVQEPVTLQYDTLNKYSGFIIFSEGTLQMGDSILYRIVAVDSYQNANMTYNPVSGYYKIIVDKIKEVQDAYQNDFDTPSNDFLFTGFGITSPQGFSDTALHTSHPYESPDQENETIDYTALLKIPIHLKDSSAYMSFDEIVLVEPGESGTNYGDEEFWDYVVIEGSKDDGKNWFAFESGYDCKRESFWLTKYNSSMQDGNSNAVGTPDLYQYHLVNLLQNNNFNGGDTILIRFRLFSNPYVHGWGWTVDNLKIQGDVSIGEKKIITPKDFHIYPNPTSGSFTITGTFHQPVKHLNFVITDLVGRQIYSRELVSTGNYFNEQFNINNQPAGLYLVIIIADNQRIVRKLLKSR